MSPTDAIRLAVFVAALVGGCASDPAFSCPEGQLPVDGICTPNMRCGAGTVLKDHQCVPSAPVRCGLGTVEVDGTCRLAPPPACGPGTARLGSQCVLAGNGPGAVVPSSAMNYSIDAEHDNRQPNDSVESPLSRKWSVDLGGRVAYPLVVGDVVFAVANPPRADVSPAHVHALRLQDGSTLWGPLTFDSRNVLLAADEEHLIVLEAGGKLHALAPGSGQVLWTTKLVDQDDYFVPPVARNGSVYIAGSGGTLFAVDASSGTLRWKKSTEGSLGTVAVSGAVVYYHQGCGIVSAFQAATGDLLWRQASNCPQSYSAGETPAVYRGALWAREWVQVNEGHVLSLARGDIIGTFASDEQPAFGENLAIFPRAGALYAAELPRRRLRWSFRPPEGLCVAPVVAGARHQVFITSVDGTVYELDEGTGAIVSSDHAGAPTDCNRSISSWPAMTIAQGRLLVPAGTRLVAY